MASFTNKDTYHYSRKLYNAVEDAWCKGIDAYRFKYKKTDCPYFMDKPLLRTAWIDGWEEAEAVD